MAVEELKHDTGTLLSKKSIMLNGSYREKKKRAISIERKVGWLIIDSSL